MQKTNDNEIVQYLGVKHIINYLEVQVGLTQTEHFESCFEYCVCRRSGGWAGGGVGVRTGAGPGSQRRGLCPRGGRLQVEVCPAAGTGAQQEGREVSVALGTSASGPPPTCRNSTVSQHRRRDHSTPPHQTSPHSGENGALINGWKISTHV